MYTASPFSLELERIGSVKRWIGNTRTELLGQIGIEDPAEPGFQLQCLAGQLNIGEFADCSRSGAHILDILTDSQHCLRHSAIRWRYWRDIVADSAGCCCRWQGTGCSRFPLENGSGILADNWTVENEAEIVEPEQMGCRGLFLRQTWLHMRYMKSAEDRNRRARYSGPLGSARGRQVDRTQGMSFLPIPRPVVEDPG